MQPGLDKFFSAAQRRNFEKGRTEGEAKGRAEGEAKGRAEGKTEGRAEGKAEGRAEGKAEALLKILVRRGLALTAEQRRRIIECGDSAMLDDWLDRALSVSSTEELLALSPDARRSHGRRFVAVNGRRKSR